MFYHLFNIEVDNSYPPLLGTPHIPLHLQIQIPIHLSNHILLHMYLQIYMCICWLVFTNKNYFVKIGDLKMTFTKWSQ